MHTLFDWLWSYVIGNFDTVLPLVGLGLTILSFRADARERKISNLLSLAASHRELWMQMDQRPDLGRIMKDDADLLKKPVTESEKRFVHLLITHFATSYAAIKLGMVYHIEGLKKDAANFFSLPIPKQVWKWSREFQSKELVAFVDECLKEKEHV